MNARLCVTQVRVCFAWMLCAYDILYMCECLDQWRPEIGPRIKFLSFATYCIYTLYTTVYNTYVDVDLEDSFFLPLVSNDGWENRIALPFSRPPFSFEQNVWSTQKTQNATSYLAKKVSEERRTMSNIWPFFLLICSHVYEEREVDHPLESHLREYYDAVWENATNFFHFSLFNSFFLPIWGPKRLLWANRSNISVVVVVE